MTPRTTAAHVELDIPEYLALVQRFETMPDHIRDLLLAFPPGSEWMKVGDTTGDWYVPQHYNDDGTIDMMRMCLGNDLAALELCVWPSTLEPLVTH